MKRYADWRHRLASYVEKVARRPFQAGEHDCALFAAGAVEAMTGEDLAAAWRGTYATLEEGYGRLASEGHDDPVGLASALLTEIPPAFGRPGDIAAIPNGNELALGVVQGAHIWVLQDGNSGLGLRPLTDAARMFRA